MSYPIAGLLLCVVVFLLVAAVLIWIGVYVYRDATRRGMNAVLWTVIAVLAPSLVGFILYLLVRGSDPDCRCPQCGAPVRQEYAACPNCSARLRPACPNCSAPTEAGWRFCPRCAQPLPEVQESVAGPVRTKDRTLGRILLVVILIPVMLLILLILAFSAYSAVPSGTTSAVTLPMDEYRQETENPDVEQWLNACGSDWDSAYALCYESKEDGQASVQYLLYIPLMTESPQMTSVGLRSGLFGFGRTLELEFVDGAGSSGGTLLLVACTGKDVPGIQIEYNGERIACEITQTDYPLDGTEAFREQYGSGIWQQQIG